MPGREYFEPHVANLTCPTRSRQVLGPNLDQPVTVNVACPTFSPRIPGLQAVA